MASSADGRKAKLLEHIKKLIEQQRRPIDDIIRENALQYLPAKSLLRFKSVSKQWRRWISSPFFIHTQSNSFRSLSGLFINNNNNGSSTSFASLDPSSYGVPDASLEFLPDDVHVCASSNGLLLCRGKIRPEIHNPLYYVCNPATRDWSFLPSPDCDHGGHADSVPVLSFQPSILGFDADFEVVVAFRIGDFDGIYGFEVFSSRTGRWRPSTAVCDGGRLVPFSGVISGSVFLWRTSLPSVVACYDADADKCWLSEMPPGFEGSAWQIGEVMGRVCCVCIIGWTVTVYAMDGRGGWEVMRFFDVRDYGLEGMPRGLPFNGGDEVLIWIDGWIFACGVVSEGTVRSVSRMESYNADCVPYVNSLVPVKGVCDQ
ncbi:F-box protein [Acorus gramineus]|uniref:F-box protein n=1 Tax=Acorus gramineus TaxID=55184 RepID=A0AAV9AV83_ACOGR|nr:F-box protein [Acorus gramineus]